MCAVLIRYLGEMEKTNWHDVIPQQEIALRGTRAHYMVCMSGGLLAKEGALFSLFTPKICVKIFVQRPKHNNFNFQTRDPALRYHERI